MKLDVSLRERALVSVDGKPARYLGPGRHRVSELFRKVQVRKLDLSQPLVELTADEAALVPPGELMTLTLASHQRAIVSRRGRPVLYLKPGEHQLLTAERTGLPGAKPQDTHPVISVEVLDTRATSVAPLPDDVRAIVPAGEYVEVTAPEGSVVIRYVDGALDAVLPAGRHAAFTTVHKVQLAVIDLRERLIHVTGQEVMTKDRVSLRLNVSAAFSVVDAKRLATVGRAPDELLYLAMQLVAREAVSARTLDELLAQREAMSAEMMQALLARAETLGFRLVSFGVKDVVLPGEMKALLNRVIEAQKEAEANVILRREETAATRSMAQTAKVLAENPLLVRLKELEAYKELAGKVGQVHVVLGEGAMPQLQLK